MEVGKHCQVCKELDFLPFTCSACSGVYCKLHRIAHPCSAETTRASKIHSDLITPAERETCSFCKKSTPKLIDSIICENCSLSHCIAHRHHHECANRNKKEEEAQQRRKDIKHLLNITDKPTTPDKTTPRRKPKWNYTVELMKLKTSATGQSSVPTNDRVYFKITLFPATLNKEVNMFFAKETSIGKLLDTVCFEHKIENNNNKPDVKEKLYISNTNGERIDPSLTILKLLERKEFDVINQIMLNKISM